MEALLQMPSEKAGWTVLLSTPQGAMLSLEGAWLLPALWSGFLNASHGCS